jgi:signal transduction histidine kinase
MDRMRPRPISLLACGLMILLAFVLAPRIFPSEAFQVAMGDVVPLLLLGVACFLCCRNGFDSRGHTRLFWSLMATGMAMWWFNQAGWTWFEVVLHKPLPDPFEGDIVLFLHIVPIMGAVAIRPHEADEKEGTLISALNVFILLVWWVVVYAFFVFPEEYLAPNIPVYTLRWDLLYVVEGLMLIGLSASAYFSSPGGWRKLYGSIAIASILYTIASETLNAAIARGTYHTGGVYDIPFLVSLLAFIWVAWSGWLDLPETQVMPSIPKDRRALASLFAQLALLSLPVMGYAALFLSHETPDLRRIRFGASMGGVAILALFIFIKQHLLDQRLMQLLDRSRMSFDNLQRLQGRAVQQAKLASLGELVALAAGELEYPLSAILESSDRMAASSNLTREQLTNAQKIGQQARRAHELVSDLLSFAQQTPGEKVPLELKPLLQRALQMEGFKLENRNIVLTVEKMDSVPRVLGNSNQLLQAFVQIVENAVDALQAVGGGRLQVAAWRESEEVVIQFADSGPGLQDPERVFDPFYTTKPVGKGTGLGLSATYGVVQDHKGQISCFNRPEGGATFEVRLPGLRTRAAMPASSHA